MANAPELGVQKAPTPSWFVAAVNDSDLIATVLFCAIGLFVAAIVMVRFPDIGSLVAQYNQF